MPTPSAGELTTMNKYPQELLRYLAILPRLSLWTARVNGSATRDARSGAIYEIPYDTAAGSLGSVKADMTLDIGTAAGLYDVGQMRLRAVPAAGVIKVGATAPGLVNVLDNHFLTVRDEYRIWQKPWRLVTARSGSTAYDDQFTQFKDHNEAYTNQNTNLKPWVRITGGQTAQGEDLEVRYAGFNDPGQTYRTVTLKARANAVARTANISTYSWNIADCTLVSGTLASAQITIRVPTATLFRHVYVTVTDTLGTATLKACPLLCYNGTTNTPYTKFTAETDDRDPIARMTFRLWGNTNEAATLQVEAGAPVIYFEIPDFNGDPAPDVYDTQYLGYAIRQTPLLKLEESDLVIETVSAPGPLNNLTAPNDQVSDNRTVARWNHIPYLTPDRLLSYLIYNHSTYLNYHGVTDAGLANGSKEENIDQGGLWDQIAQAVALNPGREPWPDKAGHMTVRTHPSLMTASDYAALTPVAALTEADITHKSAIALQTELERTVGQVTQGGKGWDGDSQPFYLSKAPGRLADAAPGRLEPRGVVLPTTAPGATLNDYSSNVFTRENAPRKDTAITLLANRDHIRPGETISVSWNQETVHGVVLVTQLFQVRKVSAKHSLEPGEPSKEITLHVEQITRGTQGQLVPRDTRATPAPQPDTPGFETPSFVYPTLTTPPVPAPTSLIPSYGAVSRIAVAIRDRAIQYTANFDQHSSAGGPTWLTHSLISSTPHALGAGRIVTALCPDAITIGGPAGAYLTSDGAIYYAAGVGTGGFTLTLKHQNSWAVGGWPQANIDADYLQEPGKFIITTWNTAGGTNVHVVRSKDYGATWQEVLTFATASSTGDTPGVRVDPNVAGRAYVFGRGAADAVNFCYQTDDYGDTWTKLANIFSGLFMIGNGLYMPAYGRPDRLLYGYTGAGASPDNQNHLMRGTINTGQVDISPFYDTPILGVVRYGPHSGGILGRDILTTPSGNPRKLLACVTNSAHALYGIALTEDYEATTVAWEWIQTPGAGYKNGHILDPYGDAAIVYGPSDDYSVGYWDPSGGFDNRQGNLPGALFGDSVGIMGW
jgi:hypothetical protein